MELIVLIIIVIVGMYVWGYIAMESNRKTRLEQMQKLADEAKGFTEGIMKARKLEPISTNIILKKGESAYLECECSLKETRSVRHYESGSAGIRVAKGVYLGRTRGTSRGVQELQVIDTGTLTLSNKRLIFNGSTSDKTIQLDKIIAVNPDVDCIEISSENKQKSSFFTVNNPMIWGAVIKVLSIVDDPQDLSKDAIDFQFNLPE